MWIAVASLVWSCNETTDVTPQPQENTFSANILQNSGSAMSRVRGIGFGGPIGAIYGNLTSGSAGRSAGSPLAMSRMAAGRTATDSANHEVPECLTETWEDDGAGNYTYTLDFGDGCDYYGEFMKGKLVETGNYSDNNFSSSATYTNFGGEDWSIDGTYSYSGTWDESAETDESNPEDSVWLYSASYQFEADLIQKYTEILHDEETDAETETEITVTYVANGSESMDQDSYTVESRNESVEVSTGESFTSQVDAPLFMDYTCGDDVWIFVSGVESGSYTHGDETGTYSIDYGDGSCDNIISVTENGVTEEVDLGDEWDDWEEECGSDDHG